MDKSKITMAGFVLVLVIVVTSSGIHEIASHRGDQLRISNELKCHTGPGYSDNPPYYAGNKHYWWIRITLCARTSVTDVVVSNQLGSELMLEGFSFVPIDKPGPYNYTLVYTVYEVGAAVGITDGTTTRCNYLDEQGVALGDFHVYWSEETLKTHWEWNIGSMSKGAFRELYLTISTDTNPAGQQEFVAPGKHFLNSGPIVEGVAESTGLSTGATCTGIEIEVLRKTE